MNFTEAGKKILHKLASLHYQQEYLCLASGKPDHSLNCYIAGPGDIALKDITSEHLFVGYKPVIVALPEENTGTVKVIFTKTEIAQESSIPQKQIVAWLELEKIKTTELSGTISFYECIKGDHSFLNTIQKKALALSNRLYNDKPGNVYLKGNLYEQVQIAYSIPRKICLVTVGEENKYNLFPTDLHGAAENYYIISLRKEGKACRQVLNAGKLLLADMEAGAFKEVYALGKNHMQDLKDESQFGFSGIYSGIYNLPLPVNALRYKELELSTSFEQGIHRLLIFKIISDKEINKDGHVLAHIHNVYATWRYRNSLETAYYLNK